MTKSILLHVFVLMFGVFFSGPTFGQRQTESLNRGLIAARTSTTNVFLSWRYLKSDGYNVGFNVYRNGVKINSSLITKSTTYNDVVSTNNTYVVKAVVNGMEQTASESVAPWTNYGNDNLGNPFVYKTIPISIPDSLTMPDGTKCGYTPNDCSLGDLNGDTEMDIVLKWDPSNSRDNANAGYSGNVYIDGLSINGTKLWRIDLGRNIRAGAHYTQFMVYDLDGDGKSEIACKTAPGTKDGLGNYLSKGPAASDNDVADYRTTAGYILSGPEYLTVFSGETGEELATSNYLPARGTITDWGDGYGNRVDRFLATVAFLDGTKPSVVFGRGYYGRLSLAAWDFRNGTLSSRWVFDTGNNNKHPYFGQGNHNLSVGDVDNDGKDEIIYGSSAFDDNGTGLFSTGLGHGDAIHFSDLIPEHPGLEVFAVKEGSPDLTKVTEIHDARTGESLASVGVTSPVDVGRGMAADIHPGYPGYEFWSTITGGVYSSNGTKISSTPPTTVSNATTYNFRLWWDGDLLSDFYDKSVITNWNYQTGGSSRLLTAYNAGLGANNGTKATPGLSGDIFGDWREEILSTGAPGELRIITPISATNYRFFSLLQDPQYRLAIAWQNVGYNQPPHPGFYLGPDIEKKIVSTDTVVCYSDILNLNAAKIPYDEITWSNGSLGNTCVLDTNTVGINVPQKQIATYHLHGFSGKDSINVTFYRPIATISSASGTITANGTALSSYQWYEGETAIDGATAKQFTPTHDGVFKVKVSGLLSGCYSFSNEVDHVVVSTNLSEETGLRPIEAYPNPTTGLLTISFNRFIADASVEITNMAGIQQMTINVKNTSKKTVDISKLNSGIYFLNVITNGRKSAIKIWKN